VRGMIPAPAEGRASLSQRNPRLIAERPPSVSRRRDRERSAKQSRRRLDASTRQETVGPSLVRILYCVQRDCAIRGQLQAIFSLPSFSP
jgi:hypothetical protein